MRLILINAFILLLLDVYIYYAARKSGVKWANRKEFPYLWWSYSGLLFIGVLLTRFTEIPLILKAISLVAFFLTFTSKLFFALVLAIDDIRRLLVWLRRKLFSRSRKVVAAESSATENKQQAGISRSKFLTQAGVIIGAIPFTTLSWGIIKGGYDYRVRRQKLVLPNLPNAFHGMTIAQVSDIHSGSFYNQTAVNGGVDLLLNEKPDVIFFTGDLVNKFA